MKTQLVALLVAFALSSVGAAAQQKPAAATPTGAGAATLPIPQPAAGFVQPTDSVGGPRSPGVLAGCRDGGRAAAAAGAVRNAQRPHGRGVRAARPRDQDRGGLAPRRDRRVHRRRHHAVRHPLPDLADSRTGRRPASRRGRHRSSSIRRTAVSRRYRPRGRRARRSSRRRPGPGASGSRGARPTPISIAASTIAVSRAACSGRSCRPSTTTGTRSCRGRATS